MNETSRSRGYSSVLRVVALLLASYAVGAGSGWAYSYAGYKWSSTTVTYYVASSVSSTWRTAIQSSDATWDGAGSAFRFSYGGTKSVCDGTSQVFAYSEGSTGAPGVTSITRSGSTISMIYTNLNTYYSFSIGGSSTSVDVQNVMTHEFGHWLTLGDRSSSSSPTYCGSSSEATMCGSTSYGETRKRSLATDDKNGIKYIYGT